jgi:predicted LPLAT superfamily acyltransferase
MTHWADIAERGSVLGIRVVAACLRVLGEPAARLLLYPVVAYFFVTGRSARRASHDYFVRLRRFAGTAAATPVPGWASGFRHMLAFAESALHKFAAWMGQIDPASVDFPNRAELEALLATGKGALLIGAHLGNLEMTRALAAGERLASVSAVVYAEHAPAFFGALAKASPDFAVNLIHVTEVGPATSMALKDKVDRGELLVIVGDRTPPAENGRTCLVDFLGTPARFAQGPFILAALLECPVYLFFCLKESDGYRIHLERFAERVVLPRAEREARLRQLVQQYAARLEAYCLRAPYQWFNFYNYWHDYARS